MKTGYRCGSHFGPCDSFLRWRAPIARELEPYQLGVSARPFDGRLEAIRRFERHRPTGAHERAGLGDGMEPARSVDLLTGTSGIRPWRQSLEHLAVVFIAGLRRGSRRAQG